MSESPSQELRRKVWAAINAAVRISDLDGLVAELLNLQKQSPESEAEILEMLSWIFKAVQRFSTHEAAAADFIRSRLLPLCLESSPEGLGSDVRHVRSEFRQILSDWLNRGSHVQLADLRREIVSSCAHRLLDEPRQEVIWTIAKIGFRDERLVEILMRLAHGHGQFAGEALGALIALGSHGDNRPVLCELAKSRLAMHGEARDLWSFVEVAESEDFNVLNSLVVNIQNDELMAPLPTAAARLADRFWNSEEAQEILWTIAFKRAPSPLPSRILYMRTDILPGFNAGKTIEELMGAMESKDVNTRFRLYGLLSSSIRPAHVKAWARKWPRRILSFIRIDAAIDTRQTGVGRTIESHLKEEAFVTTLCARGRLGAQRLVDLIPQESSKLMRGELLGLLSCFKFHRVPRWVSKAVQEKVDGGGQLDAGDYVFRKGCVELTRSAATLAALRSLINFGYTNDGHVLVSWSEAIAEVAAYLIRRGDRAPIRLLLRAVREGQASPKGLAGIDAMRHLARLGLLGSKDLQEMIGSLDCAALPTYGRNIVLETVALVPDAMSDKRVLRAVYESIGRVDLSSWYAVYALSHCRNFEFANSGLLPKLRSRGEESDIAGDSERLRGAICGVLCVREPRAYSSLAIGILRNGSDEAVYSVVHAIHQSVLRWGKDLPQSVVDALSAAVVARHTAHRSDSGLLRMLAGISTESFLGYEWEAHVGKWLSDGRAGFLEVLHGIRSESVEHRKRQLKLAREFLSDPLYAVRRAAYRVIARVDSEEFLNLCQSWSYSQNEQQRHRAGEALLWVDWKDESVFNDVYRKLATDVVLPVRDVARRTLDERKRKFWASLYLDEIRRALDTHQEVVDIPFVAGRALAKCGNEDALSGVLELLDVAEFPPHVHHWLERTLKSIRKNFQEAAKKWPEPWIGAEGAIEEFDGEFEPEGANIRWNARISLWHKFAHIGGFSEWGGTIWPADDTAAFEMHRALGSQGGIIHIPGKLPTKVLLTESIYGKNNLCRFVGTEGYPSNSKVEVR